MDADLQFIASRLSEEPFNLRLRVAEFGQREGRQLLQIANVVLSSIDSKILMSKEEEESSYAASIVGGGAGSGDSNGNPSFVDANCLFDSEWAERVVRLLTILGYPPLITLQQHDDDDERQKQEWMNRLQSGERSVVYPILQYCLKSHERLQKRAYLSKFLLPVSLPAELSGDDEAQVLVQRYQVLQEEFKHVHKAHDSLQKEARSGSDLEKDIHQLERETQQLRHRIEAMRNQSKNESAFDRMLEVTAEMRKLQDEKLRLRTNLRNVNERSSSVSRDYSQIEQRASSLRRQIDDGSSVESILHGLGREVQEVAISVRSDLILDYHIEKERLEKLERSERQPTPSEDSILDVQERVAEMESQYEQRSLELEARKRETAGEGTGRGDGATIFEKYAAEASSDLKEKKALLETRRTDASRLQSVVNDLEIMANEAMLGRGGERRSTEQLSAFGSSIRNKIKQYEDTKRNVSKMQSETASLRRTEEIMRGRIAKVDGHLREREKSEGIDGYLDAQMTLEVRSEAATGLNAKKGETLESISNVVSRIAEVIATKEKTLQPQIDLLKEKKAMSRVLEQDHKEKKERHERLSLRFAADRQALEKEATRLQDEWKDVEAAYREILASGEGAKLGLKQLEDYSTISAEYEDNLVQQQSEIERLRDEKQNIMNSYSESSKQRALFLRLEKLLRLTRAMRAGNGDGRDDEEVMDSGVIAAF
mmetsp:Transcript_15850/g.34440  ORF Transcript_15850/g.34440 Transcript_15850/m.34440 type:complete len:711 (+) Transcript_15850:147-2279(+)